MVNETLVEGDQFYNGGTGDEWDQRSAEENASNAFDWCRQRPALEALRLGQTNAIGGLRPRVAGSVATLVTHDVGASITRSFDHRSNAFTNASFVASIEFLVAVGH